MHLPSSLDHWEIVDSKSIPPVPAYYDESAIQITSIAPYDVSHSYSFDLPSNKFLASPSFSLRRLSFGRPDADSDSDDTDDSRDETTPAMRALTSARNQLLASPEVKKLGANAFFSEQWSVTTLRKGSRTRIQVTYSARPARAVIHSSRYLPPPPFIHLLATSA